MGATSEAWKFRLANLGERARERLHFARRHHAFRVVTSVRNASGYIERHLASIQEQRYPSGRLDHVIIDDASTDETAERIERWLTRQAPIHPVELVRNASRRGGCANYARAFRQAPPGSIVLHIDGDDWLPDNRVVPYLDMVYQDRGVWMTYNTYATPNGRPALFNRALPREVVRANRVREFQWTSSHLHSFRARLFAYVRDKDLVDPETGDYWQRAVDQALYLPMLELAGHHARHLPRVTYIYNRHRDSVISTNPEAQAASAARIRALPRYQRLQHLG